MAFQRWLPPGPCLRLALPALLPVALLVSGCASPDEPTARRPVVPQAVRNLQARQQGAAVVLSFSLPTQSTRREPLVEPPAIEIYRGSVENSGKPVEKAGTQLVYTIPSEMANSYVVDGRIVYRDALDAAELARASGGGAGGARIYEVRTRAARNRASAESNRVVVQVHAAPEIVGGVSARVAGQAVMLSWPHEMNAEYRVYRAEITPESAAAASADASKAVLRMPLVQVAQMGAHGEQGGLQYQDDNVEFGHAYLYFVRRVGRFGADIVESPDSSPAVITVAAVTPPAAPQGIEAIVVPAAPPETAYVSLSWAISADAGVAGYAVYRSEQNGVRGARLNENLAGSPTYRDEAVAASGRYFYSVTAVDGSGQESAPSMAVEAQIPGP